MNRVLIVDDKANNLYLLRMLLQGHGFEVDTAPHGGEALAKALDRPPDLVISDLLMPEMDGYELLRRWRADERLSAVPFVVYTATYTEPKDEELALKLGADAFIIKPTEPEPFMERVREVLDRTRVNASSARPPAGGELATLKLYNEVLVSKLEHKCKQLEARVGELIQSKARVIRMSRCHNALSAISQAIVHIRHRDALLRSVCRIAVERCGFALAWIGMLDTATGELAPVASYGADKSPTLLRALNVRGLWRTPAQVALARGHLYVCNDLQTDPAAAPIHPHLREAGLQAAAACPLRMDEDVVGALMVFASERNYFDETLLDFVTDMTTEVSFALENYEREEVRVHAEEELRRAGRQKDEFLATLAHELRNPLAPIQTAVELIRLRNPADATVQRARSIIERQVLHLTRLVDDLLDVSRITLGTIDLRLEMVDVGTVTISAIESVKPTLEAAGLTLEQQISQPAPLVRGDAFRLAQCILNLLNNAVKFTPRAGHIVMRVAQDGPMAVVEVSDTGIGIAPANLERIFEPFMQEHPSGFGNTGLGIGLALTRKLVTLHGGTIRAASGPPRQGSSFRIELPVAGAGNVPFEHSVDVRC
jgi:signal transduction histidine kinase/CheY-like chemotaxis protein